MFRTIIAAVALLALLAACGEAGGEPPQPTPTEPAATATPEPTAEPTPAPTQPPGGAGGGDEGTVVPILTPFPSPPPVADEWATFTQPASEKSPAFTFSYPPTWFVEGGEATDPRVVGLAIYLRSWDPSTSSWDKPWLPPNSINVDFISYPAAGSSGCGDQTIDPQTGEGTPRPGAAPATLGGVSGWQGVTLFDPVEGIEGGVTRSQGISVVHQGYCFQINAYFAQDEPDETTFWQIVNSFRFTK